MNSVEKSLQSTTPTKTMATSVALLLLLVSVGSASYCGKTAVPYSFEVLPNGAPVLGCAQPSCVAAAEEPLIEDSEFLTDVTGQSDGFFRDGDRSLKRYRHDAAPKLVANCSGSFSELSCPRKNQFVGGIEYIDHPRQPLILQCCTYDGLRFSQEVGTTSVGPGEAITGGEVVRGGRQISFDVIANVRKIVRSTGSQRVSYEVTVRRMNCLPDPPEPEIEFDEEVPQEVLKVLSSASSKDLNEKTEKKTDKKENKKSQKQHAAPTEEISENTNDRPPQNSGRNSEVALGPNTEPVPPRSPEVATTPSSPPPAPQQFQQPQQPQQPPQQPQQPQQPVEVPTTTAFPTLPTLIPTHSFPTLPPHTFPSLPPHSFPTLPPHTFPPFTFAPIGVTAAPAGFPGFPAAGFGADGSAPTLPTLAPFPGFPGFPSPPAPTDPAAALPQAPQTPAFGATGPQPPPFGVQPTGPQPPPGSQPAAMGTILQNFQGNYRPIELPGLGIVGYTNSKK